MTEPRVFQPGTITVVVNGTDRRVYVGAAEVKLFSSMSLIVNAERGEQAISIEFKPSSDPEEKLRAEEEKRLIAALGWMPARPAG